MKKNLFLKIAKGAFIGFSAIILVTIGIDASDNFDNLSNSLIGRILFNESEGPCPADMSFVPSENGGFCVDKYEASPGSGCAHLNVNDQSMTRDNINLKNCFPVSKPNALPWRFISQSQAQTACAKAGKRLPTDAEWYQAALGTPDKKSGWSPNDCQVNSNWQSQPGLTGSGADCVSAYGAFDMVGNVWEWVKGEANEGIYEGKTLPDSGYITAIDINGIPMETHASDGDENFNLDYFWIKNTGQRSLARGGYWDNQSDAGVYSAYLVSPGTFAGIGIGFRCVK